MVTGVAIDGSARQGASSVSCWVTGADAPTVSLSPALGHTEEMYQSRSGW